MKLLTNIPGIVLCTAIAVTAQASDSQQASNIEAPKAQPSIDALREKATRQCIRYCFDGAAGVDEDPDEWDSAIGCAYTCGTMKVPDDDLEYMLHYGWAVEGLSRAPKYLRKRASWLQDLLDADIQYPSADQNNQYRHVLESIENLKRQFTYYPTNEMGELERKANSEDDVNRTALLRDGKPFESTPANECTDAPSYGDLLDRDSDSPSADEDEDAEYADFLSSNWEYADKISALWNTDRIYDIKDEAESGLQAPARRQLYA
ncbi:hypothetical protein J4E81_002978 [Alternaria sp. BMP 2799]|nr:hypothetical protein J4E81_002978 [Alternaria sp. BMP 2799]